MKGLEALRQTSHTIDKDNFSNKCLKDLIWIFNPKTFKNQDISNHLCSYEMIRTFKIIKLNLFNYHLLEVSHMLRNLVDNDKLFYLAYVYSNIL